MRAVGCSLALQLVALMLAGSSTAQTLPLHIVVIAGEDAVNVIQRNTATAPIVEVRDANNLPVAGVAVTFTIGSPNAASFAGGGQTVTATTGPAGRATAAALNPKTAGRFQIRVQASFLGQTSAATISQVNVLTAAAAGAAGGAAAGVAAGTAAAGAASGGGLSGVAIGAIAGGAAAGTVVAVKAAKGSGSDDGGPPTTTFSGTFAEPFSLAVVVTPGNIPCSAGYSLSGTVTIMLQQQSGGTVSGTGRAVFAETQVSITPACTGLLGLSSTNDMSGAVTGTPGALTFSEQRTTTSPVPPDVTTVRTLSFTGTLSNGVISGAVTFTESSVGHQAPPGTLTITSNGTTTFPVTLR